MPYSGIPDLTSPGGSAAVFWGFGAWVAPRGRVGYGPVTPGGVAELIAYGMLEGADHELCRGCGGGRPWMRDQQRLCFARVGVTDPLCTEDYVAHGGLAGLRRALALDPAEVVSEVTESGLRGRGGAGFPAGVKWKTVAEAAGDLKFVCCNADEGDSGTFADRMLMEGDPFCLIEGMTVAAHAVGATEGYVYVRSESPDAVCTMRLAIDIAYARGWLGENVLGSGLRFDLHVRVGAGAYICGEETSMLESLEGKRGMVRAKPPTEGMSDVSIPRRGPGRQREPAAARQVVSGTTASERMPGPILRRLHGDHCEHVGKRCEVHLVASVERRAAGGRYRGDHQIHPAWLRVAAGRERHRHHGSEPCRSLSVERQGLEFHQGGGELLGARCPGALVLGHRNALMEFGHRDRREFGNLRQAFRIEQGKVDVGAGVQHTRPMTLGHGFAPTDRHRR